MEIVDVGAHLDDLSYKLVADRHRHRNGALRPFVPVVDVQIGSADAGSKDANQYIVDADGGFRNLLEPQSRLALALDECFHLALTGRVFQRIGVRVWILRVGTMRTLEILFDQYRKVFTSAQMLFPTQPDYIAGDPIRGTSAGNLDSKPAVLIEGLRRLQLGKRFQGKRQARSRPKFDGFFNETGLAELRDFGLVQPQPQLVSVDAQLHWILEAPE